MRTYTIGEVLQQLKDEFDDITISKIRYLEQEGLVSPQRTPSGYRKFTPADIERLRYVLRAQRDRYLPLKVIREELARIDAGLPPSGGPAPPPPPPPPPADRVTVPPDPIVGEDGEQDVRLELRDLCARTGLEEADVRGLIEHGLVDDPPFDHTDLEVATAAARLLDLGLEARHLRMFRQFADRHAALAEQLVAPLLRQRNPDARRAASAQLEDLARAGLAIQQALLARALRAVLGG